MKYLVIVESPSKCKKIEKYLNDNNDFDIYEVVATAGHITQLKTLEDIDIENEFTCNYQMIESKKKQIDFIRQKIKKTNEVILACDNDREGEGICFFICHVFGLDVNKTKRILFNEITEEAILRAVQNPTKIDMNLVYAQQTRQILDLLVGFEISPLLWKYICSNTKNSLSAGRCQTPALKIINDNQKEMNLHPGKQVYKTIGYFIINNLNIAFELNKTIHESVEMRDILESMSTFTHTLNVSSPKKKWYSSPEPFTTSKIQQVSSNELHISPKETMKICQTLYEKGFITYMRTDSKNYSNSFLKSAHKYITTEFEDKYFNNDYLKKAEQEENENKKDKVQAHEAIRPTDISLEEIPNIFDTKERKVYKLIWQNTVESLMTKACYYRVESKITTVHDSFFVNVSEQIHFPGWKIVKKKYEESCKEYNYLSLFINKPEYKVNYTKITSNVHVEETKTHYSEAKLVQMLEEKGIGRPSTFASLVEKIQEREYIKKEDVLGKSVDCLNYELESQDSRVKEKVVNTIFGNEKGKLIVQPLGVVVIDFLEKHFQELFNYQYTKQMEDALDSISQGTISKQEVCKKFYNQILLLKEKISEKKTTSLQKESIKIDENHTFIIGKNGPVIKCIEGDNVTFKPIKKGIDIYRLKESNINIDEIVDSKKMELKQKRDGIELGEYQGETLLLKKGKYGLYASWGENTKSLKQLGNRPMNNIRLEDVLKILEK